MVRGLDSFPALSTRAAQQVNERCPSNAPKSVAPPWGPDAGYYPRAEGPRAWRIGCRTHRARLRHLRLGGHVGRCGCPHHRRARAVAGCAQPFFDAGGSAGARRRQRFRLRRDDGRPPGRTRDRHTAGRQPGQLGGADEPGRRQGHRPPGRHYAQPAHRPGRGSRRHRPLGGTRVHRRLGRGAALV